MTTATVTKTSAATFTDIKLEEMEKFLKRAFYSLEPTKGNVRGEVIYDLHLSEKVAIRIFTSITPGGSAASVGSDAIRISLYGTAKQRPLKAGKSPIVKRTQGWRDNLKDRIEDEVEDYYSREGYWEGRA